MIWYYEIFSRYFNMLCNAVSHFLATNNHLNFFLLKKDKFGQEGLFSILLSVMWWLISLVFGWLVFFSSCFGTYVGENMNTWIWSTFQMIVWDFHNSAIFNYAGLVVYTPLSYIKQSLSTTQLPTMWILFGILDFAYIFILIAWECDTHLTFWNCWWYCWKRSASNTLFTTLLHTHSLIGLNNKMYWKLQNKASHQIRCGTHWILWFPINFNQCRSISPVGNLSLWVSSYELGIMLLHHTLL